MKITELVLKNFEGVYATMHISYLRLDLTKTKNKICLITGPNGHGKTVLLSQLNPFATLGTLDERDALPLIREGKNGYKKIVILNNDDEYLIEHFYAPSSKGSHTIKSYIKKNGEELNPNGNVTSFKEAIKLELDMEQEYMKLVRLGNNVVNMIDLKSAERKTFISKILEDANIYLVHYKKINSEVSSLKTLISHLVDKIKKTNIDDIDDAEDTLIKLKKELTRVEDNENTLKTRLSEIEYQIKEIPNVDRDELASLKRKLEKSKSKVIEGDLDALENDLNNLKIESAKLKESMNGLHEKINLYVDTVDECEKTININSEAIRKSNESSDIEGLTLAIKDLENKLRLEEDTFKDYADINYSKEDIEKLLAFLKEKQESLTTIYSFGNRPIKKVVELMLSGESVQDYISSKLMKATKREEIRQGRSLVNKLLSTYDTKPPKGCPGKCGLKSLVKDLEDLSSSIEDHDDNTTEFYSYMNLSYNTIKVVLLSFTENAELFKNIPNYLKESFKTENILKKISSCELIYDRDVIFNEIAFITSYELFLSHKEDLKDKRDELKKISKKSSLAVFNEQLENALSKRDQYTKKIIEVKSEYNKTLKDLGDKERDISDLEEYISIVKDKKDIESRYLEMVENTEKLKQLSVEANKLNSEIYYTTSEKSRYLERINKLEFDISTAKSLNKELKVYNKYYDDWILLRKALSSNTGIPLIFIDLYLNKARQIINELLDQIYDGNIFIEKFDIKSDSFTIPFDKDGKVISDIRYASQGERSFFSIALSFAISFQSMSKYNIMLLDELDSVLDESNRAKFIAILEKLIDMINADQIFVISHNNMFSMYPVDMISVLNLKLEGQNLANFIKIETNEKDKE